jgi:signal transduction histidine kinase
MRPLSLRAHLVIGAAFWMVGFFGLAIVVWHIALGHREPPSTFFAIFRHAHLFALSCVGCVVVGALQVRRGWRSINRIRTDLAGVHATPGRRLEGTYAAEVAPLVADLNRLLDQRDAMVERASATAGDLAHGLKTPLAVLTHDAERAARDGHRDLADSIAAQVDRMRRQVDHHLARSRVDVSRHRVLAPVAIAESADGIVRTLTHLYAERGLSFDVRVEPALAVLVPREDLDEIIGNVLDNACKWARTRCRLSAATQDGRVAIVVEDDGPGIPPEMRGQVLARGVRADEAVPGSGLGLSIVRDLTDAYGGQIALDDSPLGGLCVTIELPASSPSDTARR